MSNVTLAVLLLFTSSGIAFAECGDLQIAALERDSGKLTANVDKIILEAGYHCTVELVSATSPATFSSMTAQGHPDIASGLWANTIRQPLNAALNSGAVHAINANPDSVVEGWWILQSTAKKHPELKTVLDVLQHPALFPDADDPEKGAFVGCQANWPCQTINANLFRAFGMETKGWTLVDPDQSSNSSIAEAVARGENWFGYYWSPSAMTATNTLVKLDFGVEFAGIKNWDGCITKAQEDCADPKPGAWSTETEVHTIVTDRFKQQARTEVMDYLSKRTFPVDVMNSLLVYMDEQQVDSEIAAVEFLRNHASLWATWVTADAAAGIKASLD